MNREEAIEVLIDRYNSGVIRSRTNDDEWRLATDTAIAALREPARKPCGWCNDGVMQIVDSPNKPPIRSNYCGLCGRKLRDCHENCAECGKEVDDD